ncbi:type II toxin-antitoxin system VapC family toxin [Rhizobium sp. AQ_MP]|uniref:type II toxin-antitoxin system VapC family toxin n=1 Tax=Rhizobium sp. AQ_MP TaxID=2761536 RepID=UPI001AED8D98|nr:type II toxin-antitoxin system VapC family toxin [Rhizobium sp. AQ_MP]
MVYLDTSLLVAWLTREPSADRVSLWLRTQETGSLHISGWTITEFSSALSLKQRTGQINLDEKAQILAAFNRLVSRSLVTLNVTPSDYQTAARLCDRTELGLRAGDSLHIAISVNAGLPIATLDKTMSQACSTIVHPVTSIE